MSKIRGKKGFESPSQEDLDDYLRKSRKSITQMKEGKPPIIFKPKRTLPVKFIGILILLVVSSSLMLGGSFINFDSPKNSTSNGDTTTVPTTVPSTTTSSQMETTQPTDIEEDITTSIPQVEALINTMIASNHSLINPVIVNGTINRSQTISDLELFDLVWILSQFDHDSDWWILGRSLIFETYLLWNQTSYLAEPLSFQLLALRSMVAYSPASILLNGNSLGSYQNFSKMLWTNVSSSYSNETGMFNPDNKTQLSTEYQIIFSQVLAKSASHTNLFNVTSTKEIATHVLDTLDTITGSTDGLPESFGANLTFLSDMYYSRQQADMILALDELRTLLGSIPIVNTITSRLNDFSIDVFLQQDWSVAHRYNYTFADLSPEIKLTDQLSYIRANIHQNKRNLADFAIDMIKSTFRTVNSSYFTSTDDHEYQYLTEHVHLLLSFEEFLKLEQPTITDTRETTTEETGSMAGIAWEFVIILITFAFISYRRRQKK